MAGDVRECGSDDGEILQPDRVVGRLIEVGCVLRVCCSIIQPPASIVFAATSYLLHNPLTPARPVVLGPGPWTTAKARAAPNWWMDAAEVVSKLIGAPRVECVITSHGTIC